jgi:hypothetical protein
MLSESAGARRLAGTPCSSMQAGLHLLLVGADAVESIECIALWMPVSYTLPGTVNGDRRCCAPR